MLVIVLVALILILVHVQLNIIEFRLADLEMLELSNVYDWNGKKLEKKKSENDREWK